MLPQTIETIIQQIGGRGINGAIVYTGTSKIAFAHPDYYHDCECRPEQPSSVTPEGFIDYQVGVALHVNGKRGKNWTIVVSYEPSDTYTVRMWESATPKQRSNGIWGRILDEYKEAYSDNLKHVVEAMYDNLIMKHCGGFIPL